MPGIGRMIGLCQMGPPPHRWKRLEETSLKDPVRWYRLIGTQHRRIGFDAKRTGAETSSRYPVRDKGMHERRQFISDLPSVTASTSILLAVPTQSLSFKDPLESEIDRQFFVAVRRVAAVRQTNRATAIVVTHEALAQRHPKSRSLGRKGTPAELVLRLLARKHVRNWSYHS